MGRYVSGDWDWKFAFGDQDSTFGEIIENLTDEIDDVYCSRYVGTQNQGEKVELSFNSEKGIEDFKAKCKEFCGDVEPMGKYEEEKWCKCELKKGNDYWDKLMIKKFIKKVNFNDYLDGEMHFYVEY